MLKFFSESDIVMSVEVCLKIVYQTFYRQKIKCMGSQKEILKRIKNVELCMCTFPYR